MIVKINQSFSERMTRDIAFQFGRKLVGGAIIAIFGDLGSGKTVYSQGIAKGLGIQAAVTSPTFNIVHQYKETSWTLNHVGLYGLEYEYDVFAFGIEELIKDSKAITVIE